MKLFERGGLNVVGVCAVVFGLGMGASVVLNVLQAQRASDDHKQLKGQIDDLTYQVAQDHKQITGQPVGVTPAPQATPDATPEPSSTPAVAGTQAVKLADLGVSLTVDQSLADMTYANQSKNGVTIEGLTTASLQAKYPKCVPSFLGQITKRTDGQKPGTNEHLIKSLNGFSYYYIKPVVECATDAPGKALRASLINTLQNTALSTLN